MADYRHSTDRVDGVVIVECSKCDEYRCEAEYSGAVEDAASALKQAVADTCPACGSELTTIEYETPSEVIE